MRSRPVQRDGAGTMFGQLNAGKRSIVLDLKKPEAIAAVKKLVAKVDIVLENYRPGVMKRLGLDYPELAKINPRIIYGAISGYGQTGPGAGPAGLCAGDPCLDRLRRGASLLPAGPRAAGQLRHLRRRLRLGRLCAGRHPGGAASAPRHRQGPDGRRLDVRDAGRHAAGRGQSRAVRLRDAVAADVRPGRGQGRLRHAGDGERAHLPGHGDGRRPARLADRSALREIRRPAHELGPVRRRVRALVQDAHGQGVRRRAGEARRALLALSHRHRGAAGSAGRPSRLAVRDRGQRRQVPLAGAALPLLRLAAAERPQGRRARRAHAERAGRGRPQPDAEIKALAK